jgi:uncharacterized protein (DUF1015 family)
MSWSNEIGNAKQLKLTIALNDFVKMLSDDTLESMEKAIETGENFYHDVIALSNLKTTFHIDVRSIKYSVDD